MENTDTRKLKSDVQEQLRKQVVRLRKAGKTYKVIGEIVGIHFTNACKFKKPTKKTAKVRSRPRSGATNR